MIVSQVGNVARTPGLAPLLVSTGSQNLDLTSHLKEGALVQGQSLTVTWSVKNMLFCCLFFT